MSWMTAAGRYGLMNFYSGMLNYAFNQGRGNSMTSIYCLGQGIYISYLSIHDIRNGKITLGLIKGVMSTICIAKGILNLYTVLKEADDLQCRMWPDTESSENMYIQACNAFECKTPFSMKVVCKTPECDLSTVGAINIYEHLTCYILKEPIGPEGFSTLNQMKQADLR